MLGSLWAWSLLVSAGGGGFLPKWGQARACCWPQPTQKIQGVETGSRITKSERVEHDPVGRETNRRRSVLYQVVKIRRQDAFFCWWCLRGDGTIFLCRVGVFTCSASHAYNFDVMNEEGVVCRRVRV